MAKANQSILTGLKNIWLVEGTIVTISTNPQDVQ